MRLWSLDWALTGTDRRVEALGGRGTSRGLGQCQGSPSDSSGGEVAGRGLRLNSTQTAGSQRTYRNRQHP